MHRANLNLSGLFKCKDLDIWLEWMAYTNLYSSAGQFAMKKKQKQGLVAKILARTENKQEYFSLEISNEKKLIFLRCNEGGI